MLLRKVTCILLAGLLLFNSVGYRFLLDYLQYQADARLETNIDLEQYQDSELMELRIPLNLAYQPLNTAFERHYGEIEFEGRHYNYVKRKIENGLLVLKCIPNHQKDRIKNTAGILFKTVNGIDQGNEKSTAPIVKLIKNFSCDFEAHTLSVSFNALIASHTTLAAKSRSFISCGFTLPAEQPPDAAVPV